MYLTFVCVCALLQLVWTDSVQEESKLQDDLLTGYNINVRPSDQVQISCSLTLRNVLYLDIVEQTLAVSGSLGVGWQDTRLAWNESDRGNISMSYFKAEQIWRPTLVLQNSATGIEAIGDNSNQKNIPLYVHSSGTVFWLAPAYFISFCTVDVSKFPFDTQTCELKISGWLYTLDSMKFISASDEIAMTMFEENGEYEITKTYSRVEITSLRYFFVETLVFGLELRRKYSYYLVNIVLPIFFMQLLGLVVFLVPADSGEKLTFALTLLLSLTVMMTLVAEKIPTTSLQTPTLSIYMLGGAIISALEVIMTVGILYFKHFSKGEVPLGKKSRALLFAIRVFVCLPRNKIESEDAGSYSKESKQNIVPTICDIESAEDIKQKGTEFMDNNYTAYDDEDSEISDTYTYSELSAILDKFGLIIFTFITVVFTITMLLMVI